ncbi:MAG: hypothetical protein J5554_15300, partial [Paludibacteraceae bacterium]|nr:hypothetical protein [Paludibacteraceae bacterium]
TYFYHPDHLGSTSLVTNSYGEITQNISYIPYGEVFVEESAGGWQSPYYFNAKELDEETGLYYYGSRYLDPAGARWLSADPMLEKYVGMSPYNYCAGNPVGLVDPTGMELTESCEEEVIKIEKVISNHISDINKRIEEYNNSLRDEKEEKKQNEIKNNISKLQNDRAKFEAVQAEIDVLRKSDQLYDFRWEYLSSWSQNVNLKGFVGYDQEKGMFVIGLSKSVYNTLDELASFAHELKHAYQFDIGNLSFYKDHNNTVTTIPGSLYDYTDEVESHNRGKMFGFQMSPYRDMYKGLVKENKSFQNLSEMEKGQLKRRNIYHAKQNP